MWRMGVPVATPLTWGDWWAACGALPRPAGDFAAALKRMHGVPFACCFSSGRAALCATLEAMRQRSARREVVIPAFVCPSVGRAVVKAGLRPVLCDVTPRGFSLDPACLERLLSGDTLAVVAAHLYGYVSDIRPVLQVAHSAGAAVIEDAAQAFGARFAGRFAGTWGDAGVFSFGMSKVLGVGGGGAALTANPDLGRRLERLLDAAPRRSRLGDAKAAAKTAALGILTRQRHLGPLAAIWGGRMRGQDDCEDFAMARCSPAHAAALESVLPRLAAISGAREQNAAALSRALAEFDGLALPGQTPGAEPSFLRFPVVVEEISLKQELLRRLRANGINATEMYTRPSYEALRGFAWRPTACPRAEYLAERMLNLPTHTYLRRSDMARIQAVFADALARRRRTGAVAAIA